MAEKTSKNRPASDHKLITPVLESEPEVALTPSLFVQYKASHNRLLVILLLIAAFLFASFPISDPDIFPSLRVGQMVLQGEYPWGEDPFGYADGDHTAWIHPGWLGDVIIYGLYTLGGGPALVLMRALLLVLVMLLLINLGNPGPRRFLAVLTGLLGLLALCPRLYLRTEFFSYVCLALTFWALIQPGGQRFRPLHRLTAGRWYWLLPPLFLLWANLDDWFFLGPVVVLLWFLGSFIGISLVGLEQRKALGIVLVLSILATFCSPFHVKSYAAISTLLQPPANTELATRYAEQFKQNIATRPSEQLRLFLSPWSGEFFNNQRIDVINSLGSQDPLLPMFYPKGLSITEWAYYLLVLLVVMSLLARGTKFNVGVLVAMIVFALLSAWQSRLVGFFAIAGTALAIFQWQHRPLPTGPLSRARVLLGQLARLGTALILQLLCLSMLLPAADVSPSPIGHVHPRGAFGYAFRVDPSLAAAAEQLHAWSKQSLLAGRPFHVDWVDVAQYNPWFNPDGRSFFDRRYEAHSQETTASFFEVHDSLLNSARVLLNTQRETPEQRKKRQSVWQKFFDRNDISHIVVRDRTVSRTTPENKIVSVSLIFSLLDDRNEKNEPLWKPLDYHDGQVFVLAWTGSKHWPGLQRLAFDPGEIVFRGKHRPSLIRPPESDPHSLTGFLRGDPPRRPSAIEESRWYLLVGQRQQQEVFPLVASVVVSELHGMFIARLAAQVAAPNLQLFLPMLVSEQQMATASSNFLAVEAAQRAVAQLAPDAPARQRADAWEQLLEAYVGLSAYEQHLSPASSAFREPLRLHAMRQTAFACEAAIRPRAFELHLQLASLYRSRGALDTAWQHYQAARTFGERYADMMYKSLRVKFDSPSQFLEKLPEITQQIFGGSVTQFESDLKNQQQRWEQDVTQQGWSARTDETNKFVAQRAALALQAGLVNKALNELATAKTPTQEIAAVATSICMELGQYDVMLDDYLLPFPSLQTILGESDYHLRLCLGWWCKGMPAEAARERRIVAELANIDALRSLMVAGTQTLFGTATQAPGSMINGCLELMRNTGGSFSVADHQIAEGMLLLEAGSSQEAAKVFLAAFRDTEPQSPWRPLIARYYLQITGRALETDLAAK